MSRPGTTITRAETRPARSAPTDTGQSFVVGTTGTVDTLGAAGVRVPCLSLTDYATRFGSRASHTNDGGGGPAAMYDDAEFFFKEQGGSYFVSPAVYNATAGTYETNIATAMDLFTKDLGPGQISVPGRSTQATKLKLAQHAEANNRLAIADTAKSALQAALVTESTIASITVPQQERYIALFAPWVVVPGVNNVGTRTIHPSAIVRGLMSYNDSKGVTPNQPSAGLLGESVEGLNTDVTFNDADRLTLNLNGVNVLRPMYDGVRVYGYRTVADATNDANWISLAAARLFMAITAQGDAIAERFVFRQLDGRRLTVAEYGAALSAMLLPYWQQGSLFGVTAEEAFRVDVGPNVNTDASMAAGQLKANIALRVSEFAEEVILELVKVRTTEAIAA